MRTHRLNRISGISLKKSSQMTLNTHARTVFFFVWKDQIEVPFRFPFIRLLIRQTSIALISIHHVILWWIMIVYRCQLKVSIRKINSKCILFSNSWWYFNWYHWTTTSKYCHSSWTFITNSKSSLFVARRIDRQIVAISYPIVFGQAVPVFRNCCSELMTNTILCKSTLHLGSVRR